MHQPVQSVQPLRFTERLCGQPPPIDLAVGSQNTPAELGKYCLISLSRRKQHLMAELIGLNQVTAQVRQRLTDKTFPGSEPTGQAHFQHSGSYSLLSADSTVFTMSIAIVSGPTPPGTGV